MMWPQVVTDERFGVIRVQDPRVFHARGRSFCRRWIEAVTRRPGVRKAQVDLGSSTCRVEFEPSTLTTEAMAAVFSESVHEALAAPLTQNSEWVALTAYPIQGGADVWEILERSTRGLHLGHDGLMADPGARGFWAEQVAEEEGVVGCHVGRFSKKLTISFDPAMTNEDRLLDHARAAWVVLGQEGPERDRRLWAWAAVPKSPWARRLNLAKAGGSFVLTIVGVVVPGIPTVPFLLATSYYLARSSPRLNELLLHSTFFGSILNEWETHHGLSWNSKGKLIGLTFFVILVSSVVAPIGYLTLLVILTLSGVTIYGLLQIPGLPSPDSNASLPSFAGA